MKNRGNNNHSIASAFIFLLLGIFAVFGTVMVLMGVKAYRSTDEHTNVHNEYRILSSYVRSMSRTEDGYGEFRVEEVGGVQTLTIEENVGLDSYMTRIYVSDGMLREWSVNEEYEFVPEHGTPIFAAKDFKAELDGQLLTASVLTNDDEWISVDVGLYSHAAGDTI